MDFALLLLRLVVGLLLAGHGAQKLFGSFGGGGIDGTAKMFDTLGFRPPKTMALFAGLGEFGGGVLLVLGLFSPLAAVAIIGVMLNASVVHRGKGPFAQKGGWELVITNGVVATLIGFSGAGSVSLDNAIGWNFGGNGWGFTALIVGLVLGGANLALRAANLSEGRNSGRAPSAG